VILSRKGKEISIPVGTNVRAGTEIKATSARTTMDLDLIELDAGSWLILEIPGFTKAAAGQPQDSLDALRKASVTSYYKAGDALWVKLVSLGDHGRGGPTGGVSVQVSR
jgi:cell migration-inducing and hyaluronan-binding protein